MSKEITSKTVEVKNGRTWDVSIVDTDETSVLRSFGFDMYMKKLCKSSGIKSISRVTTYDGSRKVVVNYGNDTRATYILWDLNL